MGLVTMVTATFALLTDTTRPSGHKVGQLDRHKVSQTVTYLQGKSYCYTEDGSDWYAMENKRQEMGLA